MSTIIIVVFIIVVIFIFVFIIVVIIIDVSYNLMWPPLRLKSLCTRHWNIRMMDERVTKGGGMSDEWWNVMRTRSDRGVMKEWWAVVDEWWSDGRVVEEWWRNEGRVVEE